MNMKIGILTFHRAINYGAVLQCYALSETLKKMGHDVYVIDYRQPRVEKTDRHICSKAERFHLLCSFHLRSWLYYNRNWRSHEETEKKFDDFLNKHFKFSKPCDFNSVPTNFDSYIIGSDQVWNSVICDGIDPVYWGEFHRLQGSLLVSYAASTSVADMKNNNPHELFRKLSNFNALSVRDENVARFINENASMQSSVQTVLDPTLLGDASIWDKLNVIWQSREPYVLYFAARHCIKRPNVVKEKAQRIAKLMHCGLKTIDFGVDTPEQFIAKFKGARAVVTSSFHGVAFSLIFNRMLFAVRYNDEQDSRYVNVLHDIDADYMLTSFDCDNETPYEVNREVLNRKLSVLREDSLKFLLDL